MMFSVLQVSTVILVAVAMALALAHALELPGKMRLTKKAYYAMQPIYYPGFAVGGGIGEAGGTISTIILLVPYAVGKHRLLVDTRSAARTYRYGCTGSLRTRSISFGSRMKN
ncbi:MAG: hypothetical protein ACREJU_04080 [Nitrospiraceae bacterium]